ncbi:hypothetical protein NQ315_005711 [Exocentrus adspersus]|uniref:SWIM-type domain-containing protein n=1 Tax=Exocentrus adspersus TaxID=1586481 RepID=A0AAV8VI99_9CUCU|nr:hypothetical protein NQ315_005711 [Exocentrus adspersus]
MPLPPKPTKDLTEITIGALFAKPNIFVGKTNNEIVYYITSVESATFRTSVKVTHEAKPSAEISPGTCVESMESTQTKRIMCPICPEDERFSFHIALIIKHLTNTHNIEIKQSWSTISQRLGTTALDNREVNFACHTRNKLPNGAETILYNCNRSDSKGFKTFCHKRSIKSGGSIRIHGTCPSRIFITIFTNGEVTAKFTETHVQHEDELRSKRLSKSEQNYIVGQLVAGVTNDRIIQDARKINNDKLERINLITRGDLSYLITKYNIDKKRNADDMVATALNMGFPIAFLLTNRLDQIIQEFFFRALQIRLGESVEAPYNAWTKVMCTASPPRRHLCRWHVIKNWNIQGRSKIKNSEIKKDMKRNMRKILKETDVRKFIEYKENYFNCLQDEGETDFLNYLQKFYFQTAECVMMWAHCHRINAGINTNMTIESLNKLLKYNKMCGQRNIRVEKLLDLLDEIVDEKMWKKIIYSERPNSNNYQHKITMESHKKAEHMSDMVETSECGFKVQSCSEKDKYYLVYYNELCDKDCRTGYKCQCPENTIKSVICKHIHAVALFEARSKSVLRSCNIDMSDENDILYIDEPSSSQLHYQNDITNFIQENSVKLEHKPLNFDERREVMMAEIVNFSRILNEHLFDRILEKQDLETMCKKRKIEKQNYYPNKK